MKKILRRAKTPGIIVIITLLLTVFGGGLSSFGQRINYATVLYIEGDVRIKVPYTEHWVPLIMDNRLIPGDEINTGSDSTVELGLPDGSVLKIGPDSLVVIKEMGMVEVTELSTNHFELIAGKLRAIVAPFVNKDSKFIIETENATMGVRGTDFGVLYEKKEQKTELVCFDGEVEMGTREKGLEEETVLVKADETSSRVADRIIAVPEKLGIELKERFLDDMMIKGKRTIDKVKEVGVKIETGVRKGVDKIESGTEKTINKIKDKFK